MMTEVSIDQIRGLSCLGSFDTLINKLYYTSESFPDYNEITSITTYSIALRKRGEKLEKLTCDCLWVNSYAIEKLIDCNLEHSVYKITLYVRE